MRYPLIGKRGGVPGMCGRFSQCYTWEEIHAQLSRFIGDKPRNLRARYNIAPTTTVDIIRAGPDGFELTSARWGLVPGWWKKPLKDVPATFNARVEGVEDKPMFRSAVKHRRCIVPASGFFEWTGEKSDRVPHYFSAADGSPLLSFAGLWESWRDPESGDDVLSCTIIVGPANDWMGRYHDRMPMMLRPEQYGPWLDGTLSLKELRPAAEDALREWIVSKIVNKAGAGDDDPETVAPSEA
jgi:putative SOS response-associated peptidase YedK